MAPIPEDNSDKPPNKDDDEISDFSNPNLVAPLAIASESSDDESEDGGAGSGYTLLPQDPSEAVVSDYDSDREGETPRRTQTSEDTIVNEEMLQTVLASEGAAAAPTVPASQVASHPDFLSKFSDGKVPSNMQVLNLPKEKTDQVKVWNDTKLEPRKIPFDNTQESKILRAMSGFTLPPDNIPAWAHSLPDDKWQQQVVDRIRQDPPNGEVDDSSSSKSTAPPAENGDGQDWVAHFPDPAET